MKLTRFEAENYRNIEKAHIEFSPGINLLFGQNAQGKTNVMEGIYTFSRGKSFRAGSDGEQVRFGSRGFRLEIAFADKNREQTLSYRYTGGKRERCRNGAPLDSLREMLGVFRTVLFTPDHLALVKGGPAERRLFLNVAISQLRPAYITLFGRYNSILEHRNSLLRTAQKTGFADEEQIEVFSRAMAETCAEISLYRQAYLRAAAPEAMRVTDELSSGKEHLALGYEGDVQASLPPLHEGERPFDCLIGADGEKKRLTDAYFDLLSQHTGREIAAGCSLYGVHRDDIDIRLNEKNARVFASQGQQRSLALALKSAEGEISHAETGEYPVFLFDDVLSELDESRRAFVLSEMKDRQVIITACDRADIGDAEAQVIYVKEGTYGPSHR